MAGCSPVVDLPVVADLPDVEGIPEHPREVALLKATPSWNVPSRVAHDFVRQPRRFSSAAVACREPEVQVEGEDLADGFGLLLVHHELPAVRMHVVPEHREPAASTSPSYGPPPSCPASGPRSSRVRTGRRTGGR